MIRVFLSLGIVMTLGSGAAAWDYMQQSAHHPGKTLDLAQYATDLQTRVVDLMATDQRPRAASLPQVRPSLTNSTTDFIQMSPSAQIDALVNADPKLKALYEADQASARQSFWTRIRQTVAPQSETPQTNRLSAIRERNYPTPKPGLSAEELSEMSAMEIFMNRSAIQEGLANEVGNTVSQMKVKID